MEKMPEGAGWAVGGLIEKVRCEGNLEGDKAMKHEDGGGPRKGTAKTKVPAWLG